MGRKNAHTAWAEDATIVWSRSTRSPAKALKALAKHIDREFGNASVTGVSIGFHADDGEEPHWYAEAAVY